MIKNKIYNFMEAQVTNDNAHDFKKLFSPFWFFLYYLMGYPLRVLGCFLDGFVVYWLVYDVRNNALQAGLAAVIGALLIQVILGLSTTVSAKNLFRGLLFRSVAYALMFLITATFVGGSLYSTLYLSRNGSAYAVEAFAPKLQPTTTTMVQHTSDKAINRLVTQQAVSITQLEKAHESAKEELKTQIKAAQQNIKKYQRIVNSYATGATVPWEYREPIINGQRQVQRLQEQLTNLTTTHQTTLATTRKQHSEERTLARQTGLVNLEAVQTTNKAKAAKLDIYGMLAIGGNVGINLLSFFIMLGYELFLKFSQEEVNSGNRFSKPEKEEVVAQSETVAQKEKESAETFVAQGLDVEDLEGVQHPKTQFFPYEKHKKNAKLSFGRAFQVSKNPKTTQNRMATAQQHINALLWQGFDVSVDKMDKTRLVVDKLEAPTLDSRKWEGVVRQGRGGIELEKFEVLKSVGS